MRVIPLALALFATAACSVHTSGGKVDVDVEDRRGDDFEEWNATVMGMGPAMGLRAAARANSGRGQTAVAINVAGGPANGTHPWHIHTGNCGQPGQIVGNPSAYRPVQLGSDGTGTSSATVMVVLNETDNYSVRMHASPTNMTEVACGKLDD